MTGEAEPHTDERARWKELVSYGVAIFKLAWIAHERGVKLRNRDLDVSLCEDGLTVMIVVDDIARGDHFYASFVLAEKTDEQAFDASKYAQGFED